MYKEKFRQKTGLALLNAVAADDCTDGIDLADRLNELVHQCFCILKVSTAVKRLQRYTHAYNVVMRG